MDQTLIDEHTTVSNPNESFNEQEIQGWRVISVSKFNFIQGSIIILGTHISAGISSLSLQYNT